MKQRPFFLRMILILGIGALAYVLFNPELFVSRQTVAGGGLQEMNNSAEEVSAPDLLAKPSYQYNIDCANRTPQALALDRDHLITSYRNLNMVDFFDYEGNRQGLFDPFPQGRLNIAALHADSQGRLYISDAENRTILVFDAERNFLHFFPSEQEEQSVRPSLPVGIAGNGKMLMIADMGDSTVKTYLPKGEFILSLDGPQSEEQEAWHPLGVALTDDGRALVSDIQGKRVSVFSCAGKFAYFFAEPETGDGPLMPGPMAIDSLGRVHLVDSGSHRIFVYDNFGRFLFTYGDKGAAAGAMRTPAGIAIDKTNNLIFIADSGNRQIDVWKTFN